MNNSENEEKEEEEDDNKIYLQKDTNNKSLPLHIIYKSINSICKIMLNDYNKVIGTGFFVKLNILGKEYLFLVSTYHVIDDFYIDDKQELKLLLNIDMQESGNIITKKVIINLNKEERKKRKIIFLNHKDLTAIEILSTDKFINNIQFLYCDLNYIDGYYQYENQDIYILQHPDGNPVNFSTGHLTKLIEKETEQNEFEIYEFEHELYTQKGSSGSPIILVYNNRVIGVHRGSFRNKEINIGIFIGELINELNDLIEKEYENEKENSYMSKENENMKESDFFKYKINGKEEVKNKKDSIYVQINDVISFTPQF